MSESDDIEQRLAELDLSCLDDLGDGYLRKDFGPHVEALRILRKSDPDSQIKQLKESKRLLERLVDQIAPLCVETFSDALVTLSSVGRSVEQIKGQNWSVERISEAADHRDEDLESVYYELVKATESLRILNLTEELMWMRKDAQSELDHGNLAEGAGLLSRASEILASPPLSAIHALRGEREGLANQLREAFVNQLGLLVSRLSVTERSGDARDEPTRNDFPAIPRLIDSLKALDQGLDINTEVERGLGAALNAVTWKLALLATINADDSSMISELHPTTEAAVDIRAGALQSILAQASASTCERILRTVCYHMTSFLRRHLEVVSVVS
mmetsp:Transcript_43716/g.171067  ORF Transcript_43716/g.171067 Transcript_43716/m.171067 type:complete len:330 (-) Transcript_43716:1196-2185(-)